MVQNECAAELAGGRKCADVLLLPALCIALLLNLPYSAQVFRPGTREVEGPDPH